MKDALDFLKTASWVLALIFYELYRHFDNRIYIYGAIIGFIAWFVLKISTDRPKFLETIGYALLVIGVILYLLSISELVIWVDWIAILSALSGGFILTIICRNKDAIESLYFITIFICAMFAIGLLVAGASSPVNWYLIVLSLVLGIATIAIPGYIATKKHRCSKRIYNLYTPLSAFLALLTILLIIFSFLEEEDEPNPYLIGFSILSGIACLACLTYLCMKLHKFDKGEIIEEIEEETENSQNS